MGNLFKSDSSSKKQEDAQPAYFFKLAYNRFQQAKNTSQKTSDYFYNIGGHIIRLCFAGPALIPAITPALEHLSTDRNAPISLTVYLFDTVSTRTNMPSPPWSKDDYFTRGEIRGYNDETFRTVFFLDFGALNMFSNKLNQALYWLGDYNRIPSYEKSAPLRMILHWWMSQNGYQLIHSSAVGTPNGGVLIGGKGGSGKSTVVLACLNSDLFFAGDDYALLKIEQQPSVHSIYNAVKMDNGQLKVFPHLLPEVTNPDDLDAEKALIFLSSNYSERIIKNFPLRAIIIPSITSHKQSNLKKIAPAESLIRLTPSTLNLLIGDSELTFNNLGKIVNKVPSYLLELGTDHKEIPGLITDLLSSRI